MTDRPPDATLASRIVDLCLLRIGPQDLPHSPRLLAGVVAAGLLLAALLGLVIADPGIDVARQAVAFAIVLGLARVALVIRRLDARFVQVATALALADFGISLVQAPLLFAGSTAPGVDPTAFQRLLAWPFLATVFWQLGVYAHIMRHALESSFGFALVLVTAWMVATIALISLLLP